MLTPASSTRQSDSQLAAAAGQATWAAGPAAATVPDQRPGTLAQRQVLAQLPQSPRLVAAARQQAQVQQSPRVQHAAHTGLPAQLKAGIESLSGHSLDDVRVHYNSGRPAQLQAHAYAQGTDIHLAPGQEKHLPHEAWHVAQQKQGRVRPTLQLQGVAVNDNAHLEHEADVMGARALTGPAPVQRVAAGASPARLAQAHCPAVPVAQLAKRYVRALSSEEKIHGEIASLGRRADGQPNRQDEVNTWVDGFAGMPTVRYVEGKQQYYGPVGYLLEATTDQEVLANYKKDGGSNDIPGSHPNWLTALRAVVAVLHTIPAWQAWWEENLSYEVPAGEQVTAEFARGLYRIFVTDFMNADEVAAVDKPAVVDAIKPVAQAALIGHYHEAGLKQDAQNHGAGRPEIYLGPGLAPPHMEEAEAATLDGKTYTESLLLATLGQVKAAWYNVGRGDYAADQAQESWRGGDWLAARQRSAAVIQNAFVAAGAPDVGLLTLGTPAPPPPAAEAVESKGGAV